VQITVSKGEEGSYVLTLEPQHHTRSYGNALTERSHEIDARVYASDREVFLHKRPHFRSIKAYETVLVGVAKHVCGAHDVRVQYA